MDLRTRLGLNLQRLRRERAWSQEDLAFESGLHRTYVSGIERGVRNPTVLILERLARTLAVPASELLADQPAQRRRRRARRSN